MRYGMVIDLRRCVACYACVIACKAEHATPPGVLFSWALRREKGEYPNTQNIYIPMLCNHCEKPFCVEVCPTGATNKRKEDGIVAIDAEKCIGCQLCMHACPYEARYYLDEIRDYYPGEGRTPYEEQGYRNHTVGTVEKCDFCQARLKEGLEPACVANCPTVARTFGDLDDPNSEVSQILWREKIRLRSTSVYYLRADRQMQETQPART